MSSESVPQGNPVPGPRLRARWRQLFLVATIGIGVCEALMLSPGIAWNGWPDAVSTPITLIGFAAFLLLVGPFGNAATAVGLMLIGRLHWRWSWWRCVAAAAPFLYVTYRLSPKPW